MSLARASVARRFKVWSAGHGTAARAAAGPSRARRRRERVQAEVPGPVFVRCQGQGHPVTQRLDHHRPANLLGGGCDGSRVHDWYVRIQADHLGSWVVQTMQAGDDPRHDRRLAEAPAHLLQVLT
jgi:hypothetical protein